MIHWNAKLRKYKRDCDDWHSRLEINIIFSKLTMFFLTVLSNQITCLCS